MWGLRAVTPDAPSLAPDRAGGKTLYFVTTETSDVLLEAMRFCSAHLPSLDLDECARNLSAQEAAMRAKTAADRQQARLSPTLSKPSPNPIPNPIPKPSARQARLSLPGISFTVQGPEPS